MDRDYELQTHQAEDRHWWYRGRRKVLERVIDDLRLPARARYPRFSILKFSSTAESGRPIRP